MVCGVVGETIEVATPPLSMSSSVFCTDQCSSGGLDAADQVHGVEPGWRHNMMMHVDTVGLGLRESLWGQAAGSQSQSRAARAEPGGG